MEAVGLQRLGADSLGPEEPGRIIQTSAAGFAASATQLERPSHTNAPPLLYTAPWLLLTPRRSSKYSWSMQGCPWAGLSSSPPPWEAFTTQASPGSPF